VSALFFAEEDEKQSITLDLNFTPIFTHIRHLFFISRTSRRSSENDLTFHFFGAESDSIKVREAINRMVEKGRIGNFSLVSTHYALHQEPGLVVQVSKNERFMTRSTHTSVIFEKDLDRGSNCVKTNKRHVFAGLVECLFGVDTAGVSSIAR
jgi:hypothetical protein